MSARIGPLCVVRLHGVCSHQRCSRASRLPPAKKPTRRSSTRWAYPREPRTHVPTAGARRVSDLIRRHENAVDVDVELRGVGAVVTTEDVPVLSTGVLP